MNDIKSITVGQSIPDLYPSTMSGKDIQEDKQRRVYRDRRKKPMKNKVVYIHPLRRYLIVEFRFGGGSFRESFLIKRGRIIAHAHEEDGQRGC